MVLARLQAGPLETVVVMLEAFRETDMLLMVTFSFSDVTVPLLLLGVSR